MMLSIDDLRKKIFILLLSVANVLASVDQLPIVDLGYLRQQALSYNISNNYYSFLNVRYAAAPIGSLRWAAPQAPTVNTSAVDNGERGRICPNALPNWFSVAPEAIIPLLSGDEAAVNASDILSKVSALNVQTVDSSHSTSFVIPNHTNQTTEDCLFLDVFTPRETLDTVEKENGNPVLVYIHGGGYVSGSKADIEPAGLLHHSRNTGQPLVFVSLNYRLGNLGFLGGPSVQIDGIANAGLHDQRFALQWIRDNIHRFGGDPERVTVWGGSAGAGSILQQMTAFGGRQGPAPFKQAILESPALIQATSPISLEQQSQEFLSLLNASTLEDARRVSTGAIQKANYLSIALADYGVFGPGPSIDGDFVPGLFSVLLRSGDFDSSVRLMTLHTAREGLGFVSPAVQDDATFRELVLSLLPGLATSYATLEHITGTLYPSVFDGSQTPNYDTQIQRAEAFFTEAFFTCSVAWLGDTLPFQTWSSDFMIGPALHESEAVYTGFNGAYDDIGSNVNTSANLSTHEIAYAFQSYISRFAQVNDPNGLGTPFWPQYDKNRSALIVDERKMYVGREISANDRCQWWSQGLYY